MIASPAGAGCSAVIEGSDGFMPQGTDNPSAVPQSIVAPLTRAAIFLVVTLKPGAAAADTVRSFCPDLAALIRAVGFRDQESALSCVMAIGSAAWDRLFGPPRPAELHPFREIRAATRHAVATPGDLLFHIRAERMDQCFELANLIMGRLEGAADVADEVHGFRYFDNRDLLGFVDGTENPDRGKAIAAALVADADPVFTGGSYVIVQKYLHDLAAWNALPTETQERVIGRTKLSNVELDAAIKPSSAHNALTIIVEDNQEQQILRDNMPFGNIGQGEFGTYFIGYCRTPRTIEQMLENMFVGQPPGNYDRILDFSRAATGTLFFAPPAAFLDNVAADAPAAADAASASETGVPQPAQRDGSLGIGTLKGKPQHE